LFFAFSANTVNPIKNYVEVKNNRYFIPFQICLAQKDSMSFFAYNEYTVAPFGSQKVTPTIFIFAFFELKKFRTFFTYIFA